MDLAALARPARRVSLRRGAATSIERQWDDLNGDPWWRAWVFPHPLIIVAIAVVIGWAIALFFTPRAHILIESPSLNIANAAAICALRLIATGIMLAFPNAALAPRLRWLGTGLLIQTIGSVVVARGLPWLFNDVSNKQIVYGVGVIWILSGALWLF